METVFIWRISFRRFRSTMIDVDEPQYQLQTHHILLSTKCLVCFAKVSHFCSTSKTLHHLWIIDCDVQGKDAGGEKLSEEWESFCPLHLKLVCFSSWCHGWMSCRPASLVSLANLKFGFAHKTICNISLLSVLWIPRKLIILGPSRRLKDRSEVRHGEQLWAHTALRNTSLW